MLPDTPNVTPPARAESFTLRDVRFQVVGSTECKAWCEVGLPQDCRSVWTRILASAQGESTPALQGGVEDGPWSESGTTRGVASAKVWLRGLSPGTTYAVQVTLSHDGISWKNAAAPTTAASMQFKTLLPTVAGTAEEVAKEGVAGVLLIWDVVQGATGYVVIVDGVEQLPHLMEGGRHEFFWNAPHKHHATTASAMHSWQVYATGNGTRSEACSPIRFFWYP
jgi:hypothetical protein